MVHHSPDNNGVDDDDFIVEGSTAEQVRRASREESQHLRKISTESLDNIAVAILPELPAVMGVKRKRENQSKLPVHENYFLCTRNSGCLL